MSYGRSPYYIFSSLYQGENSFEFYKEGRHLGTIPYDAMAQFLASMHWRRNGEMSDLIARGYELRPELKEEDAED